MLTAEKHAGLLARRLKRSRNSRSIDLTNSCLPRITSTTRSITKLSRRSIHATWTRVLVYVAIIIADLSEMSHVV